MKFRTRQLAPVAIILLIAAPAQSQLQLDQARRVHQGSAGVIGTLEDDNFGYALAPGDFNGDGFVDLAVSSPFEAVEPVGSVGAVHVFYGDAAGFTVNGQVFSQATPGMLTAPEFGDHWGKALAAADFNLDGYADLAVGVPDEDVGAVSNAGSVTVLYGSAAGLSTNGTHFFYQGSVDKNGATVPGTVEKNEAFGEVLVTGDFNGDNYPDLAIGIPGENVALAADQRHGAVQVVYGGASGLRLIKTVANGSGYLHQGKPANTVLFGGERFGSSLAVGDFDRDQRDDLAVGSPFAKDNGNSSGEVTVFYGRNTGLQPVDEVDSFKQLPSCGGTPADRLGAQVSAGDFNGDGFSDLAVTASSAAERTDICFLYGSSTGLYIPLIGPSANYTKHIPLLLGEPYLALHASDFDGDQRDDLALGIDPPLGRGLVWTATSNSNGVDASSGRVLEQGKDGLPGEATSDDFFGGAIASADFQRDGVSDLIVGAFGDTIGGISDAGSITIIPATAAAPILCTPGPNDLCLQDRFRVTLEWQTATSSGIGKPVDQGSDDSGMFWFFEPDNWEMLVKVLDGCGVNNRFWVYAAPTTDVAYQLTLTDEATSETVIYQNALGQPAQALADVDAFVAACGVSAGTGDGTPASTLGRVDAAQHFPPGNVTTPADTVSREEAVGTCLPSDKTMCLMANRFEVEVEGRTFANPIGALFEGSVAPASTATSGIFWFFAADNWEMLVKVLDGCAITGHWWVYAAAATDVEYTLNVRDTVTGMTAKYVNPLGRLAPAETDVFALPCN